MNELYHYGVEGMKWGVRRYQNRDGSYTALGRRRRMREEYPGRKKVHTMSDDDLRKKTNRLNLENNYLNAKRQNAQLTARQRTAGEKFVTGLLATAAAAAVTGAVVGIAKTYGKNFADAFKGPVGSAGKEHGQAAYNAMMNLASAGREYLKNKRTLLANLN